MHTPEFKYNTECSINMSLSNYFILQQQDLGDFAKGQNTFTSSNPCNIYFILKRPRISINPNYLIVNDNAIECEVRIQVENSFILRKIQIKNHYKTTNIKLQSTYPYNYFKLVVNEIDEESFKTAVLLDLHQIQHQIEDQILDYEVLYIGQAYGDDGKRTALERLPSHSTLQAIYNEAIIKYPDSEIWIMLASFVRKNITLFNGAIKTADENMNIKFERFMNFSNPNFTKFTENQKINFTEAALIRLFKPKFNEHYKNTFPSPVHETYRECYNLDINSIAIDMETSGHGRWLYSDERPRGMNNGLFNYCQHDVFHFVTDEERYKMFNNEFI